jgi:gliding motility-associated-like protein
MLCFNNWCRATHIFGGEVLYTWQAANTYKITLTLYGDCSGTFIHNLDTAAPVIDVFDSTNYYDSITLVQEPISGFEVSPVCAKELWNTACKGGTLPGVRKFIYSGFINLPYAARNWRFVFNGNTGNTSTAGRSNAITNIDFNPAQPGGFGPFSIMCIEARLNNTAGPNSSPQYTTIPTPYYCNNIRQQYNQGAGDPDNDSLYFSLTPALENGQPVNYIAPYTATSPIGTSGFSFYSNNGQMNFTPNLVQDAVIVTLVQEFKNGICVGSSMREMTFIILPNCNDHPPYAILDASSIKGGTLIKENDINVCDSTLFSFHINVNDSDNDSVTVITTNIPNGATLTVNNNNTPNPTLDFSWNTTGVAPGTYNFYVNLNDNGCPLSSNPTVAFTVNIKKKPEVIYTVINPTRCLYQQHVQLTVKYGGTPKTIILSEDNKVIHVYYDTIGTFVLLDFFKLGNYHVSVISSNVLCNSEFDFTVVDSGAYPYYPEFVSPHYCQFDTPDSLIVTPGKYGQITWHDMDGNLLSGKPTFNTNTPGTYEWLVSETYGLCESNRDTIRVYVHPKPDAEITNKIEQLCMGDIVYLTASGGATYTWLPEDKVHAEKDGAFYTRVIEPTTYTLIATSEYRCKDTTTVTFNDVQPCCLFSYPDVFTPNNDGKNDGFRIVVYGNQYDYELSVYNRWGQRVFHSSNPKEYWNGMLGGKECEVGTYYYFMRAKCFSGHDEFHKGEVVLIR